MTKKPTGRPPKLTPDAKTLTTLEGLGGIMCTTKEVSAILRVTEPTLFKFFDDHPQAKERYEDGKEQGKMSLRRAQFALALKGNATLLIWLGKQHLGQADKQELTGADGGPIKTQTMSVTYVTSEEAPHAPNSEDYETEG